MGAFSSRVCAIVIAAATSVALVACDAKEAKRELKPLGAECRVSYECDGGCADRVCVTLARKAGESCGKHARCVQGLSCYKLDLKQVRAKHRDADYEPSRTYGDVCQSEEWIAEFEASRARAAERALLEKSGVAKAEIKQQMDTVEKPAKSVGPGLPVRVVRSETFIESDATKGLAACRSDERLIGGGCSVAHLESGPTHFGNSDTVGARWTCRGPKGTTVVAHALCQKLPSAKNN